MARRVGRTGTVEIAVLAFALAVLGLGQAACGRYGPPVRSAPSNQPADGDAAVTTSTATPDDADRDENDREKP